MSIPTSNKSTLKKHLIFKDNSIKESARKLKFSYDRLINILSGRIYPKKEEIKKLTNHVGIEAKELGL